MHPFRKNYHRAGKQSNQNCRKAEKDCHFANHSVAVVSFHSVVAIISVVCGHRFKLQKFNVTTA